MCVQGLVISDGHMDLSSDDQVQQLQAGQRLLVRPAHADDAAVFKVRPGWVCCALQRLCVRCQHS